eukprot:4000901-Amphidinium_carterae.1
MLQSAFHALSETSVGRPWGVSVHQYPKGRRTALRLHFLICLKSSNARLSLDNTWTLRTQGCHMHVHTIPPDSGGLAMAIKEL